MAFGRWIDSKDATLLVRINSWSYTFVNFLSLSCLYSFLYRRSYYVWWDSSISILARVFIYMLFFLLKRIERRALITQRHVYTLFLLLLVVVIEVYSVRHIHPMRFTKHTYSLLLLIYLFIFLHRVNHMFFHSVVRIFEAGKIKFNCNTIHSNNFKSIRACFFFFFFYVPQRRI